MEHFPLVEYKVDPVEQQLLDVQAHAISYEQVQAIQNRIKMLESTTDDASSATHLQNLLQKSTILVHTLAEFKALLHKVAISEEHIQALLNNHNINDHIEGYALLVMKYGDSFRYQASEIVSQ